MRFQKLFVLFLILVLASVSCLAVGGGSKRRSEKHLWRYIGMGAGAYVGVAVGWVASDDDAINSTRKAARNMVIGGIAGGVGGFFLGRAIDRRLCHQRPVDPIVRSQFLDRFVAAEAAKFRTTWKAVSASGQPVPKTVVPTMK